MTPTEIVNFVYAIPEGDLRAVNSLIVERIREKQRAQNAAATFDMMVGARVKWLGRPGKGLVREHMGTVLEVGRTRVSVRFDGDPRAWRAPASQLEIVAGPPALDSDALLDAILKPKEK